MSIREDIEKRVKEDFICGKPTFISMMQWYFPNSAGTMAQYFLSKCIKSAGYNSFGVLWHEHSQQSKDVLAYKSFDGITQFIPEDFARELCQKYNCIVIYTDHDEGNILNAKIVARWLGNKPGNLTPFLFDGKKEKIFAYYNCFGSSVQNLSGILTIFPLYQDLIQLYNYQSSIEKTFITSYAGRNKFIEGLVQGIDVKLTRNYPSKKEDLAKILQQTKVLYIFDQVTALTYEALMCGCKVVIIDQNNIFSREEYMTIEHGSTGIYLLGDNLNDSITPEIISKSVCEHIQKINIRFFEQFKKFMEIMLNEYAK